MLPLTVKGKIEIEGNVMTPVRTDSIGAPLRYDEGNSRVQDRQDTDARNDDRSVDVLYTAFPPTERWELGKGGGEEYAESDFREMSRHTVRSDG